MSTLIKFTKMHGLGNDYIYVNTMDYPIKDPSALSIQWSKRHTGIGSDGLVLIGRSEIADFSMRIFNADGSEAMMCGNASRCIGKYVYDNRLTTKKAITLDTLSGIKTIMVQTSHHNLVASATVDMGEPDYPTQTKWPQPLATSAHQPSRQTAATTKPPLSAWAIRMPSSSQMTSIPYHSAT